MASDMSFIWVYESASRFVFPPFYYMEDSLTKGQSKLVLSNLGLCRLCKYLGSACKYWGRLHVEGSYFYYLSMYRTYILGLRTYVRISTYARMYFICLGDCSRNQ